MYVLYLSATFRVLLVKDDLLRRDKTSGAFCMSRYLYYYERSRTRLLISKLDYVVESTQ